MSDFASSAYRVAKKAHRCNECRREIAPGMRYLRGVSVTDGRAETYRLCLPCDALTEYAWDLVNGPGMNPDDGPAIGGVARWLADYETPAVLLKEMPEPIAAHFRLVCSLKGVHVEGE